MADDNETKGIGGVVSAILSIVDKDTKSFINMWVFVLTPMVFMLLLFGLYNAVLSPKKPNEKCWELQVVNKITYKVNTCTGETVNLEELPSDNANEKAGKSSNN